MEHHLGNITASPMNSQHPGPLGLESLAKVGGKADEPGWSGGYPIAPCAKL